MIRMASCEGQGHSVSVKASNTWLRAFSVNVRVIGIVLNLEFQLSDSEVHIGEEL